MRTQRRLWMVALIAAYLVGCASEKSSDNNAARAPADTPVNTNNGSAPSPHSAASMAAPAGASFGSSAAGGKGGSELATGKMASDSDDSSGAKSAGSAPDEDIDGGTDTTPVVVQSGTLTAGAWDDNLNFDRFSKQRSAQLQAGVAGPLPTTDKEHADAHKRWSGERDAHQKLDVSLVIDTTGSMGDEIAYLDAELVSISETIEKLYPNAEPRWSFIVYRDEGDAYVTRSFAFTDDALALQEELKQQDADGGGDFPEAPDAAFAEMNKLDWRSGDDVARIAFWVADAPHHAERAKAMADALRGAQKLDVHIYPVASSGIDDFTELTMRSAAQLTGGRYLFLTDDSGVGGDHKEPNIPCYFVTRLDAAMLRMVDIELTGKYREPAKDDVIREGGDPQDGACTLASGDEVELF